MEYDVRLLEATFCKMRLRIWTQIRALADEPSACVGGNVTDNERVGLDELV